MKPSTLPSKVSPRETRALEGRATKSISESPPMFPAECRVQAFICLSPPMKRTGSPLTKTCALGAARTKRAKVISYRPGATVRTLVLSFSHIKLSGHVFTLWISHGTKLPALHRPDFQSQRPTQFSAHRASLMTL